jgi:hypothetical protein
MAQRRTSVASPPVIAVRAFFQCDATGRCPYKTTKRH